ncbi:MAG: PHP domain-containing protein [Sinobacterium sp.]|nr:PHP domain-containing protein [Sinobacterium sp.]
MQYDLHCHTTASDGRLSPDELADAVELLELDLFSLTDHDTIDGYLALKQAGRLGVVKQWVSGIEFSCVALKQTIHIVGLDFDETKPAFIQALKEQAGRRLQRGEVIHQRLLKEGLPDVYKEALAFAGSAESLGRPHFARALVDAGACATEQRAFDRWLGNGKIGDVKLHWPELAEVVSWINDAGGVAVLAHPLRYKMTFSKLRQLIDLFDKAGGEGVEVVGQQAAADKLKHLVRTVKAHNLAASGGSDFHDPNWHWAPLGRVNALPDELDPIWSRFKRTVVAG